MGSDVVFVCILLLFTILYSILGLTLRLALKLPPCASKRRQPHVSVIVAAHNEALHLPTCLESLLKLDYPHDKLEILVVDDDSTDNSAQIISSYAAQSKILTSIELNRNNKIKPGKSGALLVGIEASRGEIIFITDADCHVPHSWIKTTLSLFENQTALVGGFTLIDFHSANLLSRIQKVDWLFLLSVASAASQLRKPVTWVGNNLAFKRSVYDQVGGYRKLEDSYVEDFALINAINRQTEWSCFFYPSPDTRVFTFPAQSIAQLYQQRKRWATGISQARPFGWLLMANGFLAHGLIFLALFWAPPWALGCFFVLTMIDALLIKKASVLLNYKTSIIDLISFKIYYLFYTILLPIVLLFDRRIVWKHESSHHV